MKIEICESLAQSWLKHVHGCQVVQLNWKADVNTFAEQETALQIFEEATGRKVGVDNKFFAPVGQAGRALDRELSQFIRQAEIDAFGIKMDPGNPSAAPILFAVDVAFHKNGLNYLKGDKVAMKMVRSALTLLTVFGVRQGNVVFASPKVARQEQVRLAETFTEIATLFESYGLNYKFELLANEVFDNEMLIPTIQQTKDKTDTAELFMRSVQLLQLFPKALTTTVATAPRKTITRTMSTTPPSTSSIAEIWRQVRERPQTSEELKIGAALQLIIERLDDNGVGLNALRDLPNLDQRLRMGSELTVFRPFADGDDLSLRRKDSKGYNRYYAAPMSTHQLLFSSQWNYRKHYEEWTRVLREAGLI